MSGELLRGPNAIKEKKENLGEGTGKRRTLHDKRMVTALICFQTAGEKIDNPKDCRADLTGCGGKQNISTEKGRKKHRHKKQTRSGEGLGTNRRGAGRWAAATRLLRAVETAVSTRKPVTPNVDRGGGEKRPGAYPKRKWGKKTTHKVCAKRGDPPGTENKRRNTLKVIKNRRSLINRETTGGRQLSANKTRGGATHKTKNADPGSDSPARRRVGDPLRVCVEAAEKTPETEVKPNNDVVDSKRGGGPGKSRANVWQGTPRRVNGAHPEGPPERRRWGDL